MGNFIGGIEDVTSPIANLTNDLLLLEAAVGAVASVFTAFAVGAAADFETAIGNIGTLVDGLAEEEIPGLTDAILQLSTEVPQTGVQIADAFYDIQSATGAGADGFKLMEISAKSAIAGLTDTKTSADLLTTVMNSMGFEMSEATHVADVLFATVVKGKVTFDQLAANMGSFTAIAGLAGIELEQLGAAYATLTAATGLQAESATYLRSAIADLLKITPSAAVAFKEYGIATHDARGKLRNLLDVIRDISKAGLGLEQIIKLFPNRRSVQGVAILAQNFAKYEDALKLTTNSQGLMVKSFEEMALTWENRWAAMASTYQRFQIQVGTSLKDTFLPLIDSIKNVFEALGKWEKETESIASFIDKYLKPVIDDFGDALNILAENFDEIVGMVDFQPIFDALDDMGEMLRSLLDVDFTTVEGWATALQLVVDVAAGVINVTTGIIDGLKILVPVIGEAIEMFRNMDGESQKTIGEFLGITTAIDALLVPIKGMTSAISGLTTVLKTLAVIGIGGLLLKSAAFGSMISSTGGLLQGTFLSGLTLSKAAMTALSSTITLLVAGGGFAFGYMIGSWIADLPVVAGFINDVGDSLARMGQEGRKTEFLNASQTRLAEKYGVTTGKLSDLMDAMNESRDAANNMVEGEVEATDKMTLFNIEIANMQTKLNEAAKSGKENIGDLDKSMEELKDTSLETALAISEAATKFTEIEKSKKIIASINELWRAGLITAGQAGEQIGKLTTQIKEYGGEYSTVDKVNQALGDIGKEESAIRSIQAALKAGLIEEREATEVTDKHKQKIDEIKRSYQGLGEEHANELIHIKNEEFEILKLRGDVENLRLSLADRLGLEVNTSQAHGEVQKIGHDLLTLTQKKHVIDVYVEYHDEGVPE
jgi:TP901 family phage tail tape measure protein